MSEETDAYLDQQDYQEQLDNQEDMQEYQEEQLNETYSDTGEIPYRKRPDSLFSLFQKVWKSADSTKLANLDKIELGKPDISVRDAQYLALLGTTLKHKKFASFFRFKGEIILSTSASKKGWQQELFVSQKKFTARTSSGDNPYAQQKKKTWNPFGNQEIKTTEE